MSIADAIRCIPADDRETWVTMGMAVKSELGNDGFDIWDGWSRSSDRYQNSSALAVWRSIKPQGGVTVLTLYKAAREFGWKGDGTVAPLRPVARFDTTADEALAERQRQAAQKAAMMLSDCELDVHPYFASKGFPEQLVNVLDRELAVIPMLIDGAVAGCQTIDADGAKKFLYGQRSGGAEFVMGQSGIHVLCEGYATALSAQAVLRNLKTPYLIHTTFSAGNMKRIAQGLPGGVVLADNDASGTGERVAREIGWPYWMSNVVGEDFNDAHMRLGTFSLAMQMKGVMRRRR